MEQVTDHASTIYPIAVPTRSTLQTFNFYLLKEEESLTLIDAGVNTDKCWDYFTEALREHGFSLRDLSKIIITHNHEDHVGLIDRIVAKRDIPVFAPKDSIHRLKRDKDFFLMRTAFFEQLYEEMGCGRLGTIQVQKLEAARKVHNKYKIHSNITPIEQATLPHLQVIQTPGHSPDHIVLWDKRRKWLFSGDHLIRHISSNALVEPNRKGKRMAVLLKYEKSLRKCFSLDVNVAYSGHGDLIQDYKKLVTYRLNGIQRKANRLLKQMNSGISTANQLAQAVYKERYEKEFSLVMSDIIGYLDYLERNNYVTKNLKNGVWHYDVRSSPLLGHSSIDITMNGYSHVSAEHARTAIEFPTVSRGY